MGMQVDFFWDCVSPYTYLAATQIDALAQSTGADIRWRPFLLGGVFQATGNQPPAVLPPRGRYLMQDVQRWASHYDVPLKMPKAFPTNTLTAQRLACALDDHAQQVQLGQAPVRPRRRGRRETTLEGQHRRSRAARCLRRTQFLRRQRAVLGQ